MNPDVEKILDLLTWFYAHATFRLVWAKEKGNDPIPLNLLTNDEKIFVIENSLLNILFN